MTNSELLKKSFKYMCCSIIAWDDSDRKCEDYPANNIYFFSEEYKKQMCKPLEKIRNSATKILYHSNDSTDTQFNVIELKDEVVIAFRGSDSKQDWLADFNFFKIKFKESNEYTSQILAATLSKEEYNKLIFDEYVRSNESLTDGIIDFFKKCTLVSPFKNNNNLVKTKNKKLDFINNDERKSIILDLFEKIKGSIFLHKGFLLQFNSVVDQFYSYLEKYKGKKIVITGHSLGAALAKLAFFYALINYPEEYNNYSCYIYGTPKIGNKFFNDYLCKIGRDKFFNINICTDLVQQLPPASFGYTNPINNITIKNIKAPFVTKCDHTLFYYLYCYENKAPVEFNKANS